VPVDDLPILEFESRAVWEVWLDANHAAARGVWIKIAKKASGIATVTHAEALEVALCFGWIDGQRLGFDEVWFLQRFTHRRPRSRWSQINRDKVESLIEQGMMRPAGLAEIERARADGRWDAAYAGRRKMEVPADLLARLELDPVAAAVFSNLDATNRYAVLYRLHHIKSPDARVRRIDQYVEMLARGETIH
jgi:uncharacterized protein YdeI (YjbR/CyaY-like superfamily)